jgi:lysophospholipase
MTLSGPASMIVQSPRAKDFGMAFLLDRERPYRGLRAQPAAWRQRGTRTAVCRPAFGWLSSIPQNETPPGAHSGVVRTSDGLGLRYAIWQPQQSARGTVLLLQGRADFIEKYFETVGELLQRGFAVATFDWRGQGGSERLLPDPRKCHAERFADYRLDLAAVFDLVAGARLPRPVLGLAHSMGAAVLLHALASRPDLVPGAVLSAPMVAIAPTLKPLAAELLTRCAHAVGLGLTSIPGPRSKGHVSPAFDPDNLLTSDPERYERSYRMVQAAPMLALSKPTIGWMHAAFEAMAVLRSPGFAERIDTPLLAVAGDADRVTATPATLALCDRLLRGESLLLPGCGHEIMMEREQHRSAFWNGFDVFADRVLCGHRESPR